MKKSLRRSSTPPRRVCSHRPIRRPQARPSSSPPRSAPPRDRPAPTGTVTFTIDGKADSPVPLTDVNGEDQATLTLPALAAGSYMISASYSGDSNFGPSNSSTATQVVDPSTVVGGHGPTIVSVLRYGYHMMPTTLVLTFDQVLDAITAEDASDYRVIGPAGAVIGMKSAVYDPATLSVTLHPTQRIDIHYTYTLIVDGNAPGGLTNSQGQLLDGADDGRPGSDYRGPLTLRNLVLDAPCEDFSSGQEWGRQSSKPDRLRSKRSAIQLHHSHDLLPSGGSGFAFHEPLEVITGRAVIHSGSFQLADLLADHSFTSLLAT